MPVTKITRAKPLMGTFVEISASGVDEDSINSAISRAFECAQSLEDKLSKFKHESDVSRINRLCPGELVTIDPATVEVLKLSLQISQATDGLFDIVAFDSATRATSANLNLNGMQVSIKQPVNIDLAGIAKGFIVDKAFESLIQAGICECCVNAGGDMRVQYSAPKPLYVRDPRTAAGTIMIGHGFSFACATSADYYRRSQTRDLGLYRPGLGWSTFSNKSITVISDSCAISDALTKVIALEPDKERKYLSIYDAVAFQIQ